MKQKLSDRVFHISGSCSPMTDIDIINHAHIVVKNITKRLLESGATIVTTIGKNPKVDENDEKSPSIIFDWDVIEEVYNYAKKHKFSEETKNSVKIITTSKNLSRIPEEKKKMWQELISKGTVALKRISYGWNSGAVRRQRIESLCDALITIGGGEGVEHLAELFSVNGKQIIPLNIPVGSSCQDGKGGAMYLSQIFLSKPKKFIPKIREEIVSKYSLLDYKEWKEKPKKHAEAIVEFLSEVVIPQVFLVRLLNKEKENYNDVDKFFKTVVIPFIKDKNLSFKDMEISNTEEGFLNVEIFKEIINSSIVIVDVTGHRPNCHMEMGFAFGLNKRVIVTALDGTMPTFDTNCIPCYFWDLNKSVKTLKEELDDFWIKNINRESLIIQSGIC